MPNYLKKFLETIELLPLMVRKRSPYLDKKLFVRTICSDNKLFDWIKSPCSSREALPGQRGFLSFSHIHCPNTKGLMNFSKISNYKGFWSHLESYCEWNYGKANIQWDFCMLGLRTWFGTIYYMKAWHDIAKRDCT